MTMRGLTLAIAQPRILALVARQLGSLFEFDADAEAAPLEAALGRALDAVAVCFGPCRNKYYQRGGQSYFDPFHSGQNSIFLYFLARELASAGAAGLADRVYYLNKALNALDLYHAVAMPPVFFLDHPVGSVIGKAQIGSGFVFCQNCTVGNSRGVFPVIGREVTMFANTAIIGNCRIGDRVILGAGALIIDQDIPALSVVSGRAPQLEIRPLSAVSFEKRSYFDEKFLPAS